MAYGEYGEQAENQYNSTLMDFFQQQQQQAAAQGGPTGGEGPGAPAYDPGAFDPMANLSRTFQDVQPNFQQEFNQNLQAGMNPIEAEQNLPNMTQQLFGVAMGDLRQATEAEMQRQSSYQAGIDQAMGSIDRMKDFSASLTDSLGQMGQDIFGDIEGAAAAGMQRRQTRLDEYLAQVQQASDVNTAQGLKLEQYHRDMVARGDEAALRAQELGEAHIQKTEKHLRRQQSKVSKYMKSAEDKLNTMVETAEEARDKYKINTAAAAQASIAGMQARARSEAAVLTMDPNLTDAQKASLQQELDTKTRGQLQGFGSQIAMQESQLNFTADMSVAKAYGQANAGFSQLAQISNQTSATLGSQLQNALNAQASLEMQGTAAQAKYTMAGVQAGIQGAAMIGGAATSVAQAAAMATEIQGKIEDSYVASLSNAANMMSSLGQLGAKLAVQSEAMIMDGDKNIAQLYANQSFNYPSAMDAVSVTMHHVLAMRAAGMNPDNMRAFSLNSAFEGNPFNMHQHYTLPDWYVGERGGGFGTATFSGMA